jgi:hypothetical protein
MNTKTCKKCNIEKDLIEFYNNQKYIDKKFPWCKCCVKEYKKKYQQNNKQKEKLQKAEYYINNKDKIKFNIIKYREENKHWYRNYQNEYAKNRRKFDISYKLAHYLRTRIRSALNNNQKGGHLLELLGCTIKEFKKYIESKFMQGMTWDNYGKWNIDHKIPCCSFDLSDIKQQYQCFNYKNMQPLWEHDNKTKLKMDLVAKNKIK